MSSHISRHTQEEATRRAEKQEEDVKKGKRREHYYGDSRDNNKKYKRNFHIYYFRAEDLDNDNVISAVESTPTYKRTKEDLTRFQNMGNTEVVDEEQDKTIDDGQITIKFTDNN